MRVAEECNNLSKLSRGFYIYAPAFLGDTLAEFK